MLFKLSEKKSRTPLLNEDQMKSSICIRAFIRKRNIHTYVKSSAGALRRFSIQLLLIQIMTEIYRSIAVPRQDGVLIRIFGDRSMHKLHI